jgi:Fanconi anemia group M protein
MEPDLEEFISGLSLDFTKLQPREYQVRAAKAVIERGNTLVVMPTALGKTFVAVLAMAKFLQRNPKSRFLFLAPTKPLVLQQANRLAELLNIKAEAITGEMAPESRRGLYTSAQLICATPQTIKNDLRFTDFSHFAIVVFDEAHRTVGDYAYVPIAKKAVAQGCRVLALTASPSAEREKIDEIRGHLGIEHVEIKTETDEDVVDYVNKVEVEWVFVDLPPEFPAMRKQLQSLAQDAYSGITRAGFPLPPLGFLKRTDLLALRLKLTQSIKRQDVRAYGAMSSLAKLMNVLHAIDLLESQGIEPLRKFLEGFEERKAASKAVAALAREPAVKTIIADCAALEALGVEHPKYAKLKEIVGTAAEGGQGIIVFANFRDTVSKLVEELNALRHVKARQLIGRGGKGMSQKQQGALIDAFRFKEFNCMVCSSVGEEGLDIPSVDLVVFFEAVPSEIRLIQRRGRTGRMRAGKVIVLVAKGTRDEAYLHVARRKEKQMHSELERIRSELEDSSEKPADGQKKLDGF